MEIKQVSLKKDQSLRMMMKRLMLNNKRIAPLLKKRSSSEKEYGSRWKRTTKSNKNLMRTSRKSH